MKNVSNKVSSPAVARELVSTQHTNSSFLHLGQYVTVEAERVSSFKIPQEQMCDLCKIWPESWRKTRGRAFVS